MTTKKGYTKSVDAKPITDEEKEAVRSNPALVNFVVDPDSIPWGRQNSPDGDKDDVLMAESALDSG